MNEKKGNKFVNVADIAKTFISLLKKLSECGINIMEYKLI